MSSNPLTMCRGAGWRMWHQRRPTFTWKASSESGKSVQMLGKRVVVNERELFSRRPWKEDFLLGDRCGDEMRVHPVSPRAEAALVSGEAMAEREGGTRGHGDCAKY